MAGGGYGCERQEAVWRALLTAPSDFIEVGIFNALQDLFIQQIEEQHGACFTVGLGEDSLQSFKSAVGD